MGHSLPAEEKDATEAGAVALATPPGTQAKRDPLGAAADATGRAKDALLPALLPFAVLAAGPPVPTAW